jgi:hypothetical protein
VQALGTVTDARAPACHCTHFTGEHTGEAKITRVQGYPARRQPLEQLSCHCRRGQQPTLQGLVANFGDVGFTQTQPAWSACCLQLTSCYSGRVAWLRERPHGLQSQCQVLASPSKQFDDLCSCTTCQKISRETPGPQEMGANYCCCCLKMACCYYRLSPSSPPKEIHRKLSSTWLGGAIFKIISFVFLKYSWTYSIIS